MANPSSSNPRRPAPYITPAGQRRLNEELRHLWKEKRPAVTRKVAEAAAMGDRSENAEYIYGKKQLREIDRRVRYLSRRLDELVVVDRAPPDQNKVYFGAWVQLQDDAGATHTYRLVGPDEFDMHEAYISIDSVLARALLQKRANDDVEVRLPGGTGRYHIQRIWYGEPEPASGPV
jgi:transcription elongation factor GreB